MRVEQRSWTPSGGWSVHRPGRESGPLDADLVLVFGSRPALDDPRGPLEALTGAYPGASLVGCSTAGEIRGTGVHEGSVVATAIQVERGRVHVVATDLPDAASSRAVGERLAADLPHEGLRHVLLFSPGVAVNGSELARGVTSGLPGGVAVTGGLGGDDDRFERTLVRVDDRVSERAAVAVGFYGADLVVGHGSLGGWDPFGPDRLITRSSGNVLYELDGQPALALYRRYLGDHAAGLPASGLRFPLSLLEPSGEERIVRTLLGIDEEEGSVTFAGDVPEGRYARLMKANVDRLVEGSSGAASRATTLLGGETAELAILISCVGRKLVMRQRVEEEVEGVRDVLGPGAVLTGFYSYGEIAPHATGACALHNQTMTVTAFAERR